MIISARHKLWRGHTLLLALAFGITILVCEASWANTSTSDEQKSPSAEDSYIWLSSRNPQEPFKKLYVHPVSGEVMDIIDAAGSTDLPSNRQGYMQDESREQPVLRTTGDKEALRVPPADAPLRHDLSIPGAERKTRTFTGPGGDAAPMILLIDERRNEEEELYFGILSVNIKW